MSWIQKLYETYENCQSEVGMKNDDNAHLLPVSHILQKAQIEIIINQDGIIKGAKPIAKEDASTIIPCSEESGGRSGSDPKCHPLCDKLQYVAKDFGDYVEDITTKYKEKQVEMHENFRLSLEKWCASQFSHPKVEAILKYIQKGTVTRDLIEFGVLKLEANGKLKLKSANIFIRWIVYIPNDRQEKVWLDQSLYENWIKFDALSEKNIDLCYITGKRLRLARNHPKYIRIPGDSAKIISSNDTTGYTFRGRFVNVEQACGLSHEVSQKAHNALRWLIGKQGKVFFEGKSKEPGLAIVAWATSGKEIPDPLGDSADILELDKIESDSDSVSSTAQEFAIQFNKKITGYNAELGDTTDIVVLGLDSASPGRLAISFYRELTGSDFLDKIKDWHNTCCWIHNYRLKEVIDAQTGKKNTRHFKFIGAPSPKDITEAVYGKRVDDKLRKTTVERILPCIVDGQRFPRDLMESAVNRVCNRAGMDDWEWDKTLSITCALYRKYQIDYKKEEFDVALDENRNTRDYLYGRLLALADNLEEWALNEAGEKRQTNAARLMTRFAEHPFSTWPNIELALKPYIARLGNKASSRLKLISEVMTLFVPEEFILNKKLSGEFLLGYHCQREALRKKGGEKDSNANVMKHENQIDEIKLSK